MFMDLPKDYLLYDSSETEEVHFMFYCSLYDDLRAKVFSKMLISDEF